jgi:hypothetical protein
MSLRRQTVTSHGATIDVGRLGGHVVTMSGVLRERGDGAWLEGLIREWHQAAVKHELPEVVLDMRELAYANSAVFKCLTSWIRLLHSDGDALYSLRILYDKGQRWQAIGLKALSYLESQRLVIVGS